MHFDVELIHIQYSYHKVFAVKKYITALKSHMTSYNLNLNSFFTNLRNCKQVEKIVYKRLQIKKMIKMGFVLKVRGGCFNYRFKL